MNEKLLISTDRTLIDTEFVIKYLSNQSYWAKGRKPERILTAINNSLCFGVYLDNKQIGFARIVTDYGVFAWIMDLFISPEEQGNGFGKMLMKEIIEHEELQSISRWGLNTLDAHQLYKKFGFDKVEDSKLYMERLVTQE